MQTHEIRNRIITRAQLLRNALIAARMVRAARSKLLRSEHPDTAVITRMNAEVVYHENRAGTCEILQAAGSLETVRLV